MVSYKVLLAARARKDLRKLPRTLVQRIYARLKQLETDPFAVAQEKLSGLEGYRSRVGDYRIVYEVETQTKVVTVARVRHRRDVYRGV